MLPKFSGEITKFKSFWDSFDSAVNKNADLSSVDKFNYLHALLEGQAARAIQGLTLSESNYKAAVEILRKRFGKNATNHFSSYGWASQVANLYMG